MSFTGFFKTISTDVHNFLVSVFGESAIGTFEASLTGLLKQDVFVIFTDAVTAAETLTVGNDAAGGAAKRSAAFAQIVADLKSKGISAWGISHQYGN